MPAYRTHVSVNLLVAFPFAIAMLKSILHLTPSELASFSGAFIYGTLFLNPDLDLARNIRLLSFRGLLTLPFRPLSFFMKHRGISHAPILGTLLRVFWLLLVLSLGASLLNRSFPDVNFWSYPVLWLSLTGLATADLSHILLDRWK